VAYADGTTVEIDLGPTAHAAVSMTFLSELAKVVKQSDQLFGCADKVYLAPPERKPWEG